MMNIPDVLNYMRDINKRQVFHSEADFQHSFAWAIHQLDQNVKIRLEYKPMKLPRKQYIDIWITTKYGTFAIELKYPNSKLHCEIDGENYELCDQIAMDIRRHGFLQDVQRLEKVRQLYPEVTGYALLLTNNRLFWEKPKKIINTIDKNYRIHEGQIIKGGERLAWWGQHKGKWTEEDYPPVKLEKSYKCQWLDYNKNVAGEGNCNFRYLLFTI